MSSDLNGLYHVIKNTNNVIMSSAELKKDKVISADDGLKIARFVSQAQVAWALDEIKRTAEDAKVHTLVNEIKNITIGPITDDVVELKANAQETDNVSFHEFYANMNHGEGIITCRECGANMDKVEGILLASYPPQHEYVCPECGHISYRTV